MLTRNEKRMNIKKPQKGAMLSIGLNYIRFAIEEPNLFRFLFQSDYFGGATPLDLIDAEELAPVLSAMQVALGVGAEQTKKGLSDGFSICARICKHHRQQCTEI